MHKCHRQFKAIYSDVPWHCHLRDFEAHFASIAGVKRCLKKPRPVSRQTAAIAHDWGVLLWQMACWRCRFKCTVELTGDTYSWCRGRILNIS